jgi:hypothetical protein
VPAAVYAGTTVDVTVTVQNTDLTKASSIKVTFGCAEITVNSVYVSSATQLTANITAAEDASQCTGSVTVSGAGTADIICENAFTVNC